MEIRRTSPLISNGHRANFHGQQNRNQFNRRNTRWETSSTSSQSMYRHTLSASTANNLKATIPLTEGPPRKSSRLISRNLPAPAFEAPGLGSSTGVERKRSKRPRKSPMGRTQRDVMSCSSVSLLNSRVRRCLAGKPSEVWTRSCAKS